MTVSAEAINKAASDLMKKLNPVRLHFLEGCVSCGICAEHCIYYQVNKIYEPSNKAEETRFIYRKKMTVAGRLLGELVEARLPKSEEDLKKMLRLTYRCANCMYCYRTCPFGIYSGDLVILGRSFLDEVGLTPPVLKVLRDLEVSEDELTSKFGDLWNEILSKASESIHKELPLDKKGAKILYLPWVIEALLTPNAIIDTIRLLDKLGLDWTMPSKPLAIEPAIGSYIGDEDAREKVMKRIDDYILSIGSDTILLSHGGSPYPELRYEMPFVLNKKLNYNIIHVIDLLFSLYKAGKIKIEQSDGVEITWHDPCKMKETGLYEEPREILKLASKGYRELPKGMGIYSYCTGGGGGMLENTEQFISLLEKHVGMKIDRMGDFTANTEEDFNKALSFKMNEIEKSGAKLVVTGCPNCIFSMRRGAKIFGKDVKIEHISTFILDKIASS